MLFGLAACGAVEIAVEFGDVPEGLEVIVTDGVREVARQPLDARRELVDVAGTDANREYYVGAADAEGTWYGVSLDRLEWCTSDCARGEEPGWMRLSPDFNSDPVPHGDSSFEVQLVAPSPMFTFTMPETGMPHAALANCCGAETEVIGEFGTRFDFDGAPGIIGELESTAEHHQFESGGRVPGLEVVIAAIHDADGSGGWSTGDSVASAACLREHRATLTWAEPPSSAADAHLLAHHTDFQPGWWINIDRDGESPLTDTEIASLEWCAY